MDDRSGLQRAQIRSGPGGCARARTLVSGEDFLEVQVRRSLLRGEAMNVDIFLMMTMKGRCIVMRLRLMLKEEGWEGGQVEPGLGADRLIGSLVLDRWIHGSLGKRCDIHEGWID